MSTLYLTLLCLTTIASVSGAHVEVHVDKSPVTATVGRTLRLNCAIPGYGIIVHPMFARWERRNINSGEFCTISRGLTVTPGLEGISVSLIPGDYTSWYPLTLRSYRSADSGLYRCVVSGPTESKDLAVGTVHVTG